MKPAETNPENNADDHAASSQPKPAPLHPDRLTWAVLLGQWVDFARSAVGLPTDSQGRMMRDSVADIIMLQAVWFALQHLQELPPDERTLGLDRAEVLIDKHEHALHVRWKKELPQTLRELISDARQKLGEAET